MTNALIDTTTDPAIERLLDLSEKRAVDLFERVYVIRNRARYRMLRDPDAGRREFARALAVTASAHVPSLERRSYDAETLLYWTQVEVDCGQAHKRLADAERVSSQRGQKSPIVARLAAQTPDPNVCRAAER